MFENIHTTALNIYEQYLGQKSEQRVQVKASICQSLFFKIRNLSETPSDLWFDNVIEVLYERMQNEYLPSFKKSRAYIKLLQELDLLQQGNPEDDTISLNSNESSDSNENLHLTQTNKMDFLQINSSPKNVKHVRSLSDVTMLAKQEKETKVSNIKQELFSETKTIDLNEETHEKIEHNLKVGDFKLTVNIIETGKCIRNFHMKCMK